MHQCIIAYVLILLTLFVVVSVYAFFCGGGVCLFFLKETK